MSLLDGGRTLAGNISPLCWIADETGSTIWYNSRWYEFTGMPIGSADGSNSASVHDPNVLPDVIERWHASIATGAQFEMVFPLKSAEGSYHSFLTRAFPLRDASGQVVRWFGTNTDISQQLAAEAALRDADRRKDEFLATLAHELRNPLAPVRSAAKMLRAPGADTNTRELATTIIERQIQTMAGLLEDLLDVSKITRCQIALHRLRISVASIAETSLEVARPLLDARGHQLTVALPASPIDVDADPLRLSQVFSDLLTDAAKYTPPGGHIELAARPEGSGVYRHQGFRSGSPTRIHCENLRDLLAGKEYAGPGRRRPRHRTCPDQGSGRIARRLGQSGEQRPGTWKRVWSMAADMCNGFESSRAGPAKDISDAD